MAAYYSEIDPFAAQWLRNLIAAGHIAPGEVDERSIEDVAPDDLRGFKQCHFFAGIGVWSYALRNAGWPDDREVWTGSCPCQPFSTAGKGLGTADERHLWPAFFHLIEQCRPEAVFGEQVASNDGLAWLDLVQADLEGADYAVGTVDLCAAGVGAPHIRQRLYWLANTLRSGRTQGWAEPGGGSPAGRSVAVGLGHTHYTGLERHGRGHQAAIGRLGPVRSTAPTSEPCGVGDTERQRLQSRGVCAHEPAGFRAPTSEPCGVADTDCDRCAPGQRDDAPAGHGSAAASARGHDRSLGAGPTNSFWRDADWLFCRDGRWRPVEPGTFPLAHGITTRVGRVRGYGNAVIAPLAQTFIEAALASLTE